MQVISVQDAPIVNYYRLKFRKKMRQNAKSYIKIFKEYLKAGGDIDETDLFTYILHALEYGDNYVFSTFDRDTETMLDFCVKQSVESPESGESGESH